MSAEEAAAPSKRVMVLQKIMIKKNKALVLNIFFLTYWDRDYLKIFLGGPLFLWTGQLKSRQETGERERELHAAKGHRWN